MHESFYWSILSLFLGVGAYALSHVFKRVYDRRHVRSLGRWQAELEGDARDLIEAHLFVAACHRKLAEKLAEIPDDFHAPVFEALRLGARLEKAVLREARRKGLIDLLDEAQAVLDAERRGSASTPPPPGPEVEWQDGKLRPRVIPFRKETR